MFPYSSERGDNPGQATFLNKLQQSQAALSGIILKWQQNKLCTHAENI